MFIFQGGLNHVVLLLNDIWSFSALQFIKDTNDSIKEAGKEYFKILSKTKNFCRNSRQFHHVTIWFKMVMSGVSGRKRKEIVKK